MQPAKEPMMLSISHPELETTSPTAVMHVEGRAQLIAAILAAAQPTKDQARQHPVRIEMIGSTTTYRFPSGIVESRARRLCRLIRSMPVAAWR